MNLQNPLSILPSEINRDIFLRLEGKQLIIAQFVSKEWCSFIDNIKLSYTGQPQFLILSPGMKYDEEQISREVRSISLDLCRERLSQFTGHLSFGKPAEEDCMHRFGNAFKLRILCSGCGFVLLHIGEHIILWNPHTSWSTKVLELQGLQDEDYTVVGGLCYDPSISDHKVVILLSHSTPDYGGQCVYFSSLKNKGWQQVPFPYNYMTSRGGVNFNNTLHWIVSDVEKPDWDPDYYDSYYYEYYMKWDNLAGCNKIVYFDPIDDAFKTLPSPTRINPDEEDSIVGTGIIDGCFCMARKDENRQVIRVSLMKEYGILESWVTSFAISMMRFEPFHIYNLKFMSQNGKVFMMCDFSLRTYVYDVEEDKLEEAFLLGDNRGSIYYYGCLSCFYVESFDLPREVSWPEGR